MQVCQVDDLTEAPAFHVRVEDGQHQGQQREEADKHRRDDCNRLPPYSADQGSAQQGFKQSHRYSDSLRCRLQEAKMEEAEIFFHHQSGPYGVEEFDYS